MKRIMLDSGPVISLALNRLLWVFEKVKENHDISFFITKEVKKEIIDRPLNSKKYKLEALQVMQLIKKGIIEIIDDPMIESLSKEIMDLANSSYQAKGNNLKLIQLAETTAIAAALLHKFDAVMIDERTTRYIIEKPDKMKNILQHRLHTKVAENQKALIALAKKVKGVKFIRSAEFVAVAFEKGHFNHLLPDDPKAKETLLDALLWGLKLNGCAISVKDLETIKRIQLKN